MINGWLVAGLEILREREGEVSNKTILTTSNLLTCTRHLMRVEGLEQFHDSERSFTAVDSGTSPVISLSNRFPT
jgi:hypothetical protein